MHPSHLSRMKKPTGMGHLNRHQLLMAAGANHLVSAMATLVGANNAYGCEDLRARQEMVDRTLNPSYYPLNPNSDADILNTRYQNMNADVAFRSAHRSAKQETGNPEDEGDIHGNAYAMPGDPGGPGRGGGGDPADDERIPAMYPPAPRQPGKPYGGRGYQLGAYLGQMGDPTGRRLGSHRHEMAGITGKRHEEAGAHSPRGGVGGERGSGSDGSSSDPEDFFRADPTQGQNQAAALDRVAARMGGHAGREGAQYPEYAQPSAPPKPDPDGFHAHAVPTEIHEGPIEHGTHAPHVFRDDGPTHASREDLNRRTMEALQRHHKSVLEGEQAALKHREELDRESRRTAAESAQAMAEYNRRIHTEMMHRDNDIARREREASKREVDASAARTKAIHDEIDKNDAELNRMQTERNAAERNVKEARDRYEEAMRAIHERDAAVRAAAEGRAGAETGAVRREVRRREEMDRAHAPPLHGVGRDAQVMDHARQYRQRGASRGRATAESVMGAARVPLPGEDIHEGHVFEGEEMPPPVNVLPVPIHVPAPVPAILRPRHMGGDVDGDDVRYLYERRWIVGGPEAARAHMQRGRAVERDGRRLQDRGFAHVPPLARREAHDRGEHRRHAAAARQNDRRGRYAPRTDMEERRRVPRPRDVEEGDEGGEVAADPHAHMTAKQRRARRREANRRTLDERQPRIQHRKRAAETREAMRPNTRAQRRRRA
jgi:hypothetical protein